MHLIELVQGVGTIKFELGPAVRARAKDLRSISTCGSSYSCRPNGVAAFHNKKLSIYLLFFIIVIIAIIILKIPLTGSCFLTANNSI